MTENNSHSKLGDVPCYVRKRAFTQAWLLGYADAYANKGFRADYDTWPKKPQLNYENGRLILLNMKAAGVKPPPPRFKYRTINFVTAYQATEEKIGLAHDVTNEARNERFEETVTVY